MTAITDRGSAASPSIVALIIDKLVALCAVIPYALVALGLRFVMARVLFIPGQAKIEGPALPFSVWPGLDFSITLPAAIKDSTFRMFETQYAALPMPPTVAAYLFTYAEFIVPICLMLGFATRFAAAVALAMVILLQLYVAPDALWTTHIYWMSILMVLLSVGAGDISIDRLIRYIYEKK